MCQSNRTQHEPVNKVQPPPKLSQCLLHPDRKLNPIKSAQQSDRPIALWYLATSIHVGLPVWDWKEGLEASLQFRLVLIAWRPVIVRHTFLLPSVCVRGLPRSFRMPHWKGVKFWNLSGVS
ncbi:hypothetical protein BDV37DRAFT_83903 [Aspergillus pseudonomiae]|uniref:Uncharacterized protein n=1 Tax=Aspergillus pseudonomiae TaxID=1506151 RepID=A0A5N7DIC1_9EURO|nr:uncharacterized protein BDV37DRAFT_83903 [Aspergillus pseudonomiae]KAE8405869.1 hypothetical protein BDV37DRAFT_83903 [Aspergillus pseudonomiae]